MWIYEVDLIFFSGHSIRTYIVFQVVSCIFRLTTDDDDDSSSNFIVLVRPIRPQTFATHIEWALTRWDIANHIYETIRDLFNKLNNSLCDKIETFRWIRYIFQHILYGTRILISPFWVAANFSRCFSFLFFFLWKMFDTKLNRFTVNSETWINNKCRHCVGLNGCVCV